MRSGADLRGGSPLVSIDHVIDPHFVTFLAVCIQQSATLTLTYNPNPNHNPTVITDPQIGPIDPQIVTVQIRPAPHFVACRIDIDISMCMLFRLT